MKREDETQTAYAIRTVKEQVAYAIRTVKEQVAADERARCIAVLEALRTRQMNNDFTYWYLVALDDAVDALKANEETT